jgi:hypothetical protein
MSENPAANHIPAPGSRVHAAQRAEEDATPDATHVAAAQKAQPGTGIDPVPVSAETPLPVISAPAQHAVYTTVTIPASTSTVPSVRQLLPRDYNRQVAFINPIDAAIVISNSKEGAQDPQNLGTYPSGTYTNGGSPPIRNSEPVWAMNTSTSTSCRVSIIVETDGS